jgi:hypothetical protein
VKLRPIALQQSRQQLKPFGKAGFAVLVQRPAVIGGNADIFGGLSQQFFSKRANQPGIDAGEFIDLLADTLKIIVIARVFSRRTGVTDRKPGLPASVRDCACCAARLSSA